MVLAYVKSVRTPASLPKESTSQKKSPWKQILLTSYRLMLVTPIQNRVCTVNVVNAQILVVLKNMEEKVKAMVKVAKLMVLLLESERVVVFPFNTGVDKTRE